MNNSNTWDLRKTCGYVTETENSSVKKNLSPCECWTCERFSSSAMEHWFCVSFPIRKLVPTASVALFPQIL